MFSTLLYTDTRMHFVQPIPSDEPMMVSETSIRKPLDVEASGPMDLFQGWPTESRPQGEWNQQESQQLLTSCRGFWPQSMTHSPSHSMVRFYQSTEKDLPRIRVLVSGCWPWRPTRSWGSPDWGLVQSPFFDLMMCPKVLLVSQSNTSHYMRGSLGTLR